MTPPEHLLGGSGFMCFPNLASYCLCSITYEPYRIDRELCKSITLEQYIICRDMISRYVFLYLPLIYQRTDMCSWRECNYITSRKAEQLLEEVLNAVNFMNYPLEMSQDCFVNGELLRKPAIGTPLQNKVTDQCGHYMETKTDDQIVRYLLIGPDGVQFR